MSMHKEGNAKRKGFYQFSPMERQIINTVRAANGEIIPLTAIADILCTSTDSIHTLISIINHKAQAPIVERIATTHKRIHKGYCARAGVRDALAAYPPNSNIQRTRSVNLEMIKTYPIKHEIFPAKPTK